MHSRHAGQAIHAIAQTNHRREKSRRRACVSDEQFQRLFRRPCVRDFSTQPANRDRPIAKFRHIRFDFYLEAQNLQCLDHHLRVLAPERPGERDLAIRQRREDEGAVRDALRAGHGDFGAHRFGERDDFNEIGQRH